MLHQHPSELAVRAEHSPQRDRGHSFKERKEVDPNLDLNILFWIADQIQTKKKKASLFLLANLAFVCGRRGPCMPREGKGTIEASNCQTSFYLIVCAHSTALRVGVINRVQDCADNITCNTGMDSSCGDIFVPFSTVCSMLNPNDTVLGALNEQV